MFCLLAPLPTTYRSFGLQRPPGSWGQCISRFPRPALTWQQTQGPDPEHQQLLLHRDSQLSTHHCLTLSLISNTVFMPQTCSVLMNVIPLIPLLSQIESREVPEDSGLLQQADPWANTLCPPPAQPQSRGRLGASKQAPGAALYSKV